MNLLILIAMVVLGVSTIVMLVHVTGGGRTKGLADAHEARQRFAADYPNLATHGVVLTAARDAAFIEVEGGRVGIVQVFGSHFLTRLLDARSLARWHRDGATVELRSTDFTWTGGRYAFAGEVDAGRVVAMIEPIGDDGTGRQKA